MLVDTHVHVSLTTYEPVEILLAQMQHNGVHKALLVQVRNCTENAYVIECKKRYPGKFCAVCWIDVNRPDAINELERLRHEGADSIRLTNFDWSPGADPYALWRSAEALGMSVKVGGCPTAGFAAPQFVRLLRELPNLKLVFEHLASFALQPTASRPKATEAEYRAALRLAEYPNTYMNIHGLGEICKAPFPYKNIPPYVRMAYDAFGPKRLMWGSNWPPVVMEEGYRNALRYTMQRMTYCSQDDLEWIFGKTALSVWKFESSLEVLAQTETRT